MKISISVTDATVSEHLIYEGIVKPLIDEIFDEFLGMRCVDGKESEENE